MINENYSVPQGWQLRENQNIAIERAFDAFKRGKKIVAIEGPTGSGKSLIGVTLSSLFPSSFYLVPLKALQDQIWSDFGEVEGTAIFKGKANYLCTQYTDYPTSVEAAPCQGWNGADERKHCRENNLCPYYSAMEKASKSKLTLLNFTLFLAWMRLKEKHPSPPIQKRFLHIVDEAHKIESFVRDFLTINFSEVRLQENFGLGGFPDYLDENSSEEDFVGFLRKMKMMNDRVLEVMRKKYWCDSNDQLRVKASESRELKDIAQYHLSLDEKLEYFLKDTENYAFGFERRWHSHVKDMVRYIVVKPLKPGAYIRENVLGEYTLLLSATLPKQKILSMGFSEDEIEYIDMPSTFPAENRPIIFKNLGTMNQRTIESLYPVMTENVVKIMRKNSSHKGIIHAPSYRVAEVLEQSIRKACPDSGLRLLLQSRDTGGAMKALKQHQELDHPTVLLSPGMKEGIDLKDDLSRFQIILKCPYPSLGDPVVKKLSELDYLWYVTETLIDFFQMYGRSVRSETDWAETYVFDNHLRALIVKHKFMVPKYILEACRWVG